MDDYQPLEEKVGGALVFFCQWASDRGYVWEKDVSVLIDPALRLRACDSLYFLMSVFPSVKYSVKCKSTVASLLLPTSKVDGVSKFQEIRRMGVKEGRVLRDNYYSTVKFF